MKQPYNLDTDWAPPKALAGIPMELSVWFLEFEFLGPSRAEQHPHPCRHKTRKTHPILKLDKNLLQHKSSFHIHWFQTFHSITTRHRTKRVNFQTWQFETFFPHKQLPKPQHVANQGPHQETIGGFNCGTPLKQANCKLKS